MAESGGLDVILGWMCGGGRFVGVWLLGSVLVLLGVGLWSGVMGLWLLGNGLVLSGVSRMVSLFPMFNAMVSWMLREEVRLWRNGSAW